MRKEVLWWGAVVVISAALGLIFALVVLAVRSDPEPAASSTGSDAGSQAGSDAAAAGSAAAKPEMTTVTVTTQPPGALLFTADGKPLGKEPLVLPAAVGSTVVVLAKLDGFPPVTNFAEDVEAGETITIRLDLFRDGSQDARTTKPERKQRDRDADPRQQGSGSATPERKKRGSGYDGQDIVE